MQFPRTSAQTGARIFCAAILLLLIGGAACSARAGTFVVTSVADPGDGTCTAADIGDGCTLREAINAANSAAGADTIDATGIRGTIQLTGVLPDLSTDININGPGSSLLTVRRNTGGDYRIFNVSAGVTVNISSLTVANGQAVNGVDGVPIAPLVPFRGTPGEPAGGIFNRGTLSLTGVDVSENRSGHGGNSYRDAGGLGGSGGGIFNTGTLIATGCRVSGNQTGYGGTGAFGNGGNGAGIYNDGTLMMINSTVSGNETGNGGGGGPAPGGGPPGGTGGYGGGIFNGGSATLVRTTVSENLTGHGGSTFFGQDSIPGVGAGIISGGTLTLSNCTISGNQIGRDPITRIFSGGGGIYHYGGAITISNSTVTNNFAFFGGGIYQPTNYSNGTVTLRSSIIAGNHDAFVYAPDIFGLVQSDGYNLINDQQGATISRNPGAGPDFHGLPDLEPLADNGGPTLTHLPRSNSPAIDKGKNFSGSVTDQRGVGFARVVDLPDANYPNAADGTDIGAVEIVPMATIRNLSTRARIDTGDKALITGFIVTGKQPKQVVLRGLGPSLTGYGIPAGEVLDDPVIELRGAHGSIITNDNWKDTQRQEIEGSQFQPQDDREAMIFATLPPAAYTLILTGKSQATGIGAIEVYDNNQQIDSQLANLSTRGFVQAGNYVMIGGFTFGGTSNPARIAIRALGPSLSKFGLSNLLQDPTLELHNGNGTVIVSNDNWTDDTTSAAELTANGLALPDPKESGIFADAIPPGQFTAIVAGKNGGIGIALVEIYNLQ